MSTNGRALRALSFIANHIHEKGFPPTLKDIKDFLGLRSIRGAAIQLEKLENQGYILRERGVSRGIKLLSIPPSHKEEKRKLPIIGEIKAGTPILAQQNIEGYVELPISKFKGRKDAFILKVNGDSMIGKGIMPGDLAIIIPTDTADDGDIVVALNPEEETATLKVFKKIEDYVALIPANPKFEPIIGRNFIIQGKVVGLVK